MNKRALFAIPLLLVTLYLGGALLSHANQAFFTAEVPILKLLAFIGCIAAAMRYGRGDYLFWAWLLLSLDYGALAANDVLLGRRINLLNINDQQLATTLRSWIIVVSNVAAAISSVMMARTWRVAGLGLPSTLGQKLVVVLGIVVAVSVVGVVTFKGLSDGTVRNSIVPIAANLGDLICFCVIAPLFLQTMALRGGTLAWPWALIVGSDIAWMIFDVTIGLNGRASTTGRVVAEGLRCAACACALTAGLAQRWAIRSAPSNEEIT